LDKKIGEIKSMYVRPEQRGKGFAKRILAELEERAVSLGFERLRLETGDKQVQALKLYRSAGYEVIPAFGRYVSSETSICMEKKMT